MSCTMYVAKTKMLIRFVHKSNSLIKITEGGLI